MTEMNDDRRVGEMNVPAHTKGRASIISIRTRQVRRALVDIVGSHEILRPVTILSIARVYSRDKLSGGLPWPPVRDLNTRLDHQVPPMIDAGQPRRAAPTRIAIHGSI